MNSYPCGFLGDPKRECTCAYHQIQRYRSKISGPLLDRMDIQVEVPHVPYKDLRGANPTESSTRIRERVVGARAIQSERFRQTTIFSNAHMPNRFIKRHCALESAGAGLLEAAIARLGLSARAYSRVLKIARTIADLAGSSGIAAEHVAEAIQYRNLDRRGLN